MESIYLTEGKGLTSSSANYLANISKEILKSIEERLDNINFLNITVELINGDKKTLQNGFTAVDTLDSDIQKVAELHAFNAWVREGIKNKEELLNYVTSSDIYKYAKLKNIDFPEHPSKDKLVTEQDIIDEMDIKSRNRYLELEAFAAAYGQLIHPGGAISDARERAFYRLQVPNEVKGDGRDMVIYNYTPAVESSKIDETFLALQNKYRNYEKELNSIKYSIKEKVATRNTEITKKYQNELKAYNNTMDEFRAEFDTWQIQERERISNLKIVIPEKLQKTYEYLESLGK